MIRHHVAQEIQSAIDVLSSEGALPQFQLPDVIVESPKQAGHGDFATNWAMMASKIVAAAGSQFPSNPRSLGELLASKLSKSPIFTQVELAGPGFINLTLAIQVTIQAVRRILDNREGSILQNPSHFGRPKTATKTSHINLEFVSVNPNGPITIGSGRGAAYGSTLANVLEAAGNTVHREYYINDGVNSEQMRLFAESVRAICLDQPVPNNGYKGDYVESAARDGAWIVYLSMRLEHELGNLWSSIEEVENLKRWREDLKKDPFYEPGDEEYIDQLLADSKLVKDLHKSNAMAYEEAIKPMLSDVSAVGDKQKLRRLLRGFSLPGIQNAVQKAMIARQCFDLRVFGVEFDTWFSEQSLHDSAEVSKCLDQLEASQVADRIPSRTKVKLGKGGSIEVVVTEDQIDDAKEDGESPPSTPSSPAQTSAEEGATETLWLRSTLFGDDQDRVLQRRDGRLTYIASDVAYHKDKFNRGGPKGTTADKLITVLGPDHHGYIGRLHAVVAALKMSDNQENSASSDALELTEEEAKLYTSKAHRDSCLAALAKSRKELEVLIFQLVRFVKDGKPAPMRKRDGNIYALIDLINEIGEKVKPSGSNEEKKLAGKDVARFFYLMRHHDTTFDFDLDLAARQSDENPVFYVQYAHARICSVLEKAKEEGLNFSEGSQPAEIHERETTLILKIADLPNEIERCAADYGVNRLATFAIELARAYHSFYDVCRVIDLQNRETSLWRLQICEATRVALKATLDLLGVSSPVRMEREQPTETL